MLPLLQPGYSYTITQLLNISLLAQTQLKPVEVAIDRVKILGQKMQMSIFDSLVEVLCEPSVVCNK